MLLVMHHPKPQQPENILVTIVVIGRRYGNRQ
jgi:hypothetical protein